MHGKILRIATILTGLSALSFTTYASAYSDYCMSAPYGWYAEINLGSTRISNISYPGKSSNSGIGGNLNLGYKFMPYFGLEMGYTRYANTSLSDQLNTKAATIKHFSYDLAAKGILPVSSSGFELFAKVGVQRNNANITIENAVAASNIGLTSSNHSNTALYLGIGGQYYFSPEIAVVVQWQRADGNGNIGIMDLYSVGFSVLFT